MPALVLGTAQWGSAYGVTNDRGRLDDASVLRIVKAARDFGIVHLDTAAGYGDAQERIAALAADFSVTTKVSGGIDATVADQLEGSLGRLARARVDRCLVHDWSALSDAQRAAAVDGLERARGLGLVGAVGVSVYTERDLADAIEYADQLSVAQVPVSVLDQRLDDSPAVADLRSRGWTIQARSVLLQGVLASPSATRLGDHRDVRAVCELAESSGVTVADVALGYIAGRPWVDEVVVGVTSADELQQIVQAMSSPSMVAQDWSDLASDDLDLIDPRRWTSVA